MLHIGKDTTLKARPRDGVDGPSPLVVLLQRERAAMADQDGARKAALNRHVGDDFERARRGIGAFVDVEVKLPAFALRELEEDAEPFMQIWRHAGDGAENPRPMSVEHRLDVGHVRGVRRKLDGEKGRRLKVDPAPPTCSRFGQDGPTDSRLWADAVDMGANGRRAVRIGAAQAELHARGDVGGGPIRGAVFDVAASAPAKSPIGFRFRRQIWPLSRWVCTSTNNGKTMRPDIATSGASPKSTTPVGTIFAIAPSSTRMSTIAKPSQSSGPMGSGSERASTRACFST